MREQAMAPHMLLLLVEMDPPACASALRGGA